jgi:hypothetical protein
MMKMLLQSAAVLTGFGLSLIFLTACEPSDQSTTAAPSVVPQNATQSQTSSVSSAVQAGLDAGGFKMSDFRAGKRYYELYCTACHAEPKRGSGPDAANRLGPPPFAVAHHYAVGFPDIRERVDAIISYTKRPTVEDALMPGAIQRFGQMSPMPLPDDQLRQIAIYLSVGEFAKPGWYDAHYAEEHGSDE